MRLTRRFFLSIAAAVLLPASPAAAQGQLEMDEVQVGILPIAGHVPVFAAQELGYLAQEGLKVVMQFSVGGAALLPVVIQGQMQIGNIPISTGLQARARNLDVVMIGPGTYVGKSSPPGQTATVVRSDSSVRKPADLAGKKVAVNVINSVNWLYNRELLAQAGIDLKSITYVEMPFPNMIDAVVNGHVDAAALVQPFLFFGESGKKVKAIGYDFVDVQPGVQVSGFAVSRKWAQSNPRTLAAFERAVARAVNYLQANEAQAKQIIVKFTKSKPEVIEGAGMPSWNNELSVSNVEKQMQLMVKHGLLQKPLDVRELMWKSKP